MLAIAAVLGFTKAETERIYLFLVPAAVHRRRVGAAPAPPPRWCIGALAAQALATELLFYTVW